MCVRLWVLFIEYFLRPINLSLPNFLEDTISTDKFFVITVHAFFPHNFFFSPPPQAANTKNFAWLRAKIPTRISISGDFDTAEVRHRNKFCAKCSLNLFYLPGSATLSWMTSADNRCLSSRNARRLASITSSKGGYLPMRRLLTFLEREVITLSYMNFFFLYTSPLQSPKPLQIKPQQKMSTTTTIRRFDSKALL